MVYHFYIELLDTNPLVWRRLVISPDSTFYQFHDAIQAAFGWGNGHLFQFSKNGVLDLDGYGLVFEDQEPDDLTKDAHKTKISMVFKTEGQEYTYVYDFGDAWTHNIKLEKIEAKEMDGVHCIGGSGACPPEDVGGIPGYQHMLKLLAGPNNKERKEFINWIGLDPHEKWNKDFFSLKHANFRLSLLKF